MKSKEDNSINETPIDWWKEFSDSLEWFHARAWTLSGGLLFLSTIYLFKFIHSESVPLSITSPSVLSSLPIMLALVIFSIITLGGTLLMPAAVLFTPIKKNGTTLSKIINKPKNGKIALVFLVRWCIGVFFVGSIGAAAFSIEQYLGLSTGLPAIIIAWIAYTLVTLYKFTPEITFRKETIEFWTVGFLLSLCQIIVVAYAILISLKVVEANVTHTQKNIYITTFFALTIVSIAQIVIALLLENITLKVDIIPKSALAGFFILLALGIFTPLGEKIAGSSYSLSSSGGRNCSILTWKDSSEPLEELIDEEGITSVPIRILATEGDFYLVRKTRSTSEEVIFISRKEVVKIDNC